MKNEEPRILIFLHIGKTGGTSLQRILEKEYSDKAPFFVTSGYFPGSKDRRSRHFEDLSDQERRDLRLIKGHINYGIHTQLEETARYITLIRDPIDRIISNYYYIKQNADHYLYEKITSSDCSLEEYILEATDNDNGQTRVLAGIADRYECQEKEVPFGKVNDEIFKIAKSNLRKFAVVGLMERFDESVEMMRRELRWRITPNIEKHNVTEGRPRKEDIDSKTLKLIEKHNQYDMRLYKIATELFEAKMAVKRLEQ